MFLLLPIAGCVTLLCTSLDRNIAWTSVPGDCDNRGSWIYQRLYLDTTGVDIAIVGTSRTINGIQDTLISRLLSNSLSQEMNIVNFGYCRFGMEMQFIMAKDILEQKNIEVIVIEINEGMSGSSHPLFPYYARTEDVLRPASVLNQAVPANYYNGFLSRLTQFRQDILDLEDTAEPMFPSYGYRGYPGNADPSTLIEPDSFVDREMNALKRFEKLYPKAWIAQLVEMCLAKRVKIYFLYMPSYHDQPEPVEGLEFYRSLAPVLIPPNASIRNKGLWRDHDHLNDSGAKVLSTWLALELLNE